ncbi:MAG: polysaccharide biosynthesis protein PslG, partial [Solirubrobacteraceae bacterium]|nr:polysaccharide biosynthesis protein PslG [Solirubrobacteraceae bacterium]
MRPSPSARLARPLGVLATAAVVVLLLVAAVATATASGQPAKARITNATERPAAKAKKRPSVLVLCLRRARKAHSAKTRAARRRACLLAAKRAKAARRKAPTTPPPPSGSNSFGADVFGLSTGGAIQNEDPSTLARDLDAIAGTHTRWVRVDINWDQIQSGGPSSYNWASVDRVVQGAIARGVKVLGTILYTPSWARPSGTSGTYGPDPAVYANFASVAVQRYAAMGVHTYEVWNEPNTTAFWTSKPDPAAYTRLLKAAY